MCVCVYGAALVFFCCPLSFVTCRYLFQDKLLEELDEKNNKVELQLMDTFHLLDVHETRLEAAYR